MISPMHLAVIMILQVLVRPGSHNLFYITISENGAWPAWDIVPMAPWDWPCVAQCTPNKYSNITDIELMKCALLLCFDECARIQVHSFTLVWEELADVILISTQTVKPQGLAVKGPAWPLTC